MNALQGALLKIFFANDNRYSKYIVPLTGDMFVPTMDQEEKVASWIGYTILSIKPAQLTVKTAQAVAQNLHIDFRLSFVGPQAEELAISTLWWNSRADVKNVFEGEMRAQIKTVQRQILTKSLEQSGYHNSLVWYTDIGCMSYIEQAIPGIPWFPLY